jgi:hypothetical protein
MSRPAYAMTKHWTPPLGIKNKPEIDLDQRFPETVAAQLEHYKNKMEQKGVIQRKSFYGLAILQAGL